MNYDVDYFIRKFEAIPEEKWCVQEQINDRGQRCAYGLCLPKEQTRFATLYNGGEETPQGMALKKLFASLPNNLWADSIYKNHPVWFPALVNNGNIPKYNQPTPKQRILAALHDIKKMQTPKREKVKPEIASDLLTFPIQERLDTIFSQVKNS